MTAITTHILDTSRGRPAGGVSVALERREAEGWQLIGRGETDADGRLRTLTNDIELSLGVYRLTFDTATYFRERHAETFFPEVTITFHVTDPKQHHHVPLLLSPFGYSTYRGS